MFVKFLLVSEYIKLRAILIRFAKREKFMHVLENRAIHLFISIHKRKERTAEHSIYHHCKTNCNISKKDIHFVKMNLFFSKTKYSCVKNLEKFGYEYQPSLRIGR